jgi:L-rhamnose mutarotase
MATRVFRMKLFPGCAELYRQRHDELWPELRTALLDAGVEDYHIYLDETDHALFAVMHHSEPHRLEELPQLPVMQRWWAYMADIMHSNPDHSPVCTDLQTVFSLRAGT